MTANAAGGARRRSDRGGAIAIGIVVVLATALYAWFALRVRFIQPDEGLHVGLARWLPEDLPGSAFELDPYVRGIQRLYVFVLAVPLNLLRSPLDWELARVMDAFLFASTAIPAYLLARELRLPRAPAVWVAALSVALPIGVVATAFLTENLAYPLAIWSFWAMWRAVDAPSPGRDALAVALIVATALTRVNFAALLGAYVLLAVLQAWRFRLEREDGGPARRVARRHPVLLAVLVVGVLMLLAGAVGVLDLKALIADRTPKSVTGVGDVLSRIVQRLTRTAVATGVLPAIAALPWMLRELARPTDRRRHALAALALLAGGATILSAAGAGFDERYTVYLAPLVLLCAAVAVLGDRPLPAWSLVAAGGLLGLVVGATHWDGSRAGGASAFAYPAETVWADLVDGPLGGGAVAVVVCLLGGLALGALVAALAGRPAWRPATAGVVAAFMLVFTLSALIRFDDAVGGSFAGSQLAFLDRHVGDDGESGIVVAEAGTLDPLLQRLDAERAFNSTANTIVTFEQPFSFGPPVGVDFLLVQTDERTGEVTNAGELPSTLGIPRSFVRLGLAGDVVARSTAMPYDTLRVQQPARARFRVDGAMADGSLAPDATQLSRARVLVWTAGLEPGSCLVVPFGVPADTGGPRTVTVRAPGAEERREIAPGASDEVAVPLHAERARGGRLPVDVEVAGYGDTGGVLIGARLGALRVEPCSG
ncbi:MAG TPA: hypothetical protein VFR97_04945 [Capillimicrobium sp.]|nr:hypothetical protein [Capillimicrobium sp.]